jgi:hypothetical protein
MDEATLMRSLGERRSSEPLYEPRLAEAAIGRTVARPVRAAEPTVRRASRGTDEGSRSSWALSSTSRLAVALAAALVLGLGALLASGRSPR